VTGRTPLWRLLAVAAGVVTLVPAVGPVKDLDAYWHVRLGDLILRTRSLPTTEPWNFPALGRRWVPHSWLSEVALALAHKAGGWGGLVALRLLLGAALLALLARAVIRGSDAVVGPLVFAVAAVALTKDVLERPQTFALVLLAALLPLLGRARDGDAPPWWLAGLLGWLWASLHGSWPLLPAALLLCFALTRRPRLALASLAAVAGAALTPVGPALLARPFLVARAAGPIAEWQRTTLWHRENAAFLLLLAALAVGWALSRRVPWTEVAWCGAVVAAGLSVERNVAFAVVLLSPVVARRLSEVVPPGRRSTVPAWTVPALAAFGAVLLALLAVPQPRQATDAPLALIQTLKDAPGQARVLNDYNAGGILTGLGGDEVSAAVDGRIDAYPPGFLRRYVGAMNLRGDWEAFVRELRPTHALLDRRVPLAEVLERERGWRRLGTNDVYVLLAAP
jgi:hypothetical protein